MSSVRSSDWMDPLSFPLTDLQNRSMVGAAPARAFLSALLVGTWPLGMACGAEVPEDAGPFAVEVVRYDPGPGGGFGSELLPDVVLGPPQGGTTSKGSTDVVSLGRGGSIILRLGSPLLDGAGPDLLVFENPFEIAGANGGGVFGEPGEVAVSEDGEEYASFPCEPAAPLPNGCAGFGVVLAGPANDLEPTDPAQAGGDAFDLADVGVSNARFVRIVDRGVGEAPPSAGFDLDAVAIVGHANGEEPR